VAFLLERMCPLSYGLGAKFNETVSSTHFSFLISILFERKGLIDSQHFDLYADAVNYITKTKGAYCILDPHNYMRYNNPSQQPMTGSVIGNSSDVTAATTAQL
jgi:endoglucanase